MSLLTGNQPVLGLPKMSLLTGPPESTGDCQSALVDKLGVSLNRYHHTMVHIANHPGMKNGPVEAAVLRRQFHSIIVILQIYQSISVSLKCRARSIIGIFRK
jgi:hypothetical protein